MTARARRPSEHLYSDEPEEFPPSGVAHGEQPPPLAPPARVAHGGCRTDDPPVLDAHPSTPALAERIREAMARRTCELHGTENLPMRLDAAMSLPDVLTTLAWDVARELQRQRVQES